MIPYIEVPLVRLGPLWLNPALIAGAAGILTAHFLLLRRARSRGLSDEIAGMMSLVMVVCGLLAAYWFRGVYLADAVRADWKTLLQLQPGAASFGGIASGMTAGWIYLRWRRIGAMDALRYMDALACVFPRGWIFGRLGCSLVHDHPGLRTASVLGVRYPDGTRFDLGTIEVLFFGLVVIPLFALLDRRKHAAGFWLGLLLSVYGGFRLWLDTLHVDPPRYGPLTVDQWAYGATLIAGLALLVRSRTFGLE